MISPPALRSTCHRCVSAWVFYVGFGKAKDPLESAFLLVGFDACVVTAPAVAEVEAEEEVVRARNVIASGVMVSVALASRYSMIAEVMLAGRACGPKDHDVRRLPGDR